MPARPKNLYNGTATSPRTRLPCHYQDIQFPLSRAKLVEMIEAVQPRPIRQLYPIMVRLAAIKVPLAEGIRLLLAQPRAKTSRTRI